MDLRYHAGGPQEQTWTPMVQEITVMMEFFPWMSKFKLEIRLGSLLPALVKIIFLQRLSDCLYRMQVQHLQLDVFDPETRQYYPVPECTHPVCVENFLTALVHHPTNVFLCV